MTNAQIKQKTAEVISSSILIFIAAVVVLIVGAGYFKIDGALCTGAFLLMIAWGVTRIVKHFIAVPAREKTEKEKRENSVLKQIEDIVSIIGVSIYFIVSFITMAWHITWIIFIIISLVNQIIRLIFSLKGIKEENKDE